MLGFLLHRRANDTREREELANERRLSQKRLRMIADLRTQNADLKAEVERLTASNAILARVTQDHRACPPRTDPISLAGASSRR